MAVASSGTCTYHGVVFSSLYKSRITSKPILDEAQRTTVYVEHTLEVDGFVVGTPTDPTMDNLRKRLTACAGALDYSDKGFGDLKVNTGGPVRDVKWGPIPELLEFIPLGGDANAAKVRWRCTTRIPECDGAKYQFAFLALNYETDWSIDQDGYTARRLSGYLEIPLTRSGQGDRSVNFTADSYRESVRPGIPLGFQRKSQDFRLSKDKRRLDFTFVDEEIPSPLPDKCTRVDARHTVSSQLGLSGGVGGFRVWAINFDVTVTLARGVPKTEALRVFQQVIGSRLFAAQKLAALNPKGAALIPQRMTFEDDIFGRTARFQITLHNLGLTIGDILNVSGLWRPIAGTGYAQWATSLQPFSHHVRGFAGLKHQPQDDSIIDLCLGTTDPPVAKIVPVSKQQPTKFMPGQGFPVTPISFKISIPQAPTGDFVNLALNGINVATSWLDYRVNLRYKEEANKVRHKRLPRKGQKVTEENPKDPSALQALASLIGAGIGAAKGLAKLPVDVFQRAAAPSREILLTGIAERIGWRVPLPQLKSVGGVDVEELDRDVKEDTIGSILGAPVNRAEWAIRYGIKEPPDGIPSLANPVLGTQGTAGPKSTMRPTPS